MILRGESMKGCKYCKEFKKAKIKKVIITFEYENPQAQHSFPGACSWDKSYVTNACPMCHRILDIDIDENTKKRN